MAKLPVVHCRLCKKEIDRNVEKENIDWIMRSRGWYYHKSCYEDWISKKNDIHTNGIDEELWKDAAYQYLHRGLRIDVDFNKFNSQWKNYLKQGKTPKGIYFSLRYFYEVKREDPSKSQNGIGIINFIYSEAGEYWVERERRERGICQKIEQQIREAAAQEKRTIQKKQTKKPSKLINIGDISEMEDE